MRKGQERWIIKGTRKLSDEYVHHLDRGNVSSVYADDETH